MLGFFGDKVALSERCETSWLAATLFTFFYNFDFNPYSVFGVFRHFKVETIFIS